MSRGDELMRRRRTRGAAEYIVSRRLLHTASLKFVLFSQTRNQSQLELPPRVRPGQEAQGLAAASLRIGDGRSTPLCGASEVGMCEEVGTTREKVNRRRTVGSADCKGKVELKGQHSAALHRNV